MDLVIDPLGGKDWRKGYSLPRPAGLLVTCGFSNLATGERRSLPRILWQLARIPRFSPLRLVNDNRAVAGVHPGALWGEIELMGEELRAVLELFEQGRVHPRVDSVFPFARAADAHRRIQERKNVGKVLLVPG
ncbi:MAG TPA: zinc-binding dehydrogenase [Anaeromyxobacteraceae bacterium]|nr:zinc-binding dehydrogenase [Anaeromyxobacteraceae bacterium]